MAKSGIEGMKQNAENIGRVTALTQFFLELEIPNLAHSSEMQTYVKAAVQRGIGRATSGEWKELVENITNALSDANKGSLNILGESRIPTLKQTLLTKEEVTISNEQLKPYRKRIFAIARGVIEDRVGHKHPHLGAPGLFMDNLSWFLSKTPLLEWSDLVDATIHFIDNFQIPFESISENPTKMLSDEFVGALKKRLNDSKTIPVNWEDWDDLGGSEDDGIREIKK